MVSKAQIEEVMLLMSAEFGGSFQERPSGWNDNREFVLQLPIGEGCEFITSVSDEESKYGTSGTTNYTAKGKRFTFDRLGVEASFYLTGHDSIRQVLEDQIEKVKAAQERIANSHSCNLGPVTLMMTQDRIDNMIETLKAGKTFQYHPPGFGTGYNFSIKESRGYYDRAKASRELELLVGQRVFVTSFDAD